MGEVLAQMARSTFLRLQRASFRTLKYLLPDAKTSKSIVDEKYFDRASCAFSIKNKGRTAFVFFCKSFAMGIEHSKSPKPPLLRTRISLIEDRSDIFLEAVLVQGAAKVKYFAIFLALEYKPSYR